MYQNYPYAYLHRVATKDFSLSLIALPIDKYSIEDNINNGTSSRTVTYNEISGSGGLTNGTYTATNALGTTIKGIVNVLNGTSPWATNTCSILANDITASPSSFPASKRYLPHCYIIKDTAQNPGYKFFVVVPTVAERPYNLVVQSVGAGATTRYIQLTEQDDTSFSEDLWDGESDYFALDGANAICVQVYDTSNNLKATMHLSLSLADVK